MRSKMLWIVLLLLSFSTLHDSFIVMLDQNRDIVVADYINNDTPVQECDELNKIHNMFHLIAIMTEEQSRSAWLPREEKMTLDLHHYSPPPTKTMNKPPIV